MSSLAEINKELQKQSSDIADMKANLAAQLKAEIAAQKKEERLSGRREEARREAQRKSPRGFREGFTQGVGFGGASGMVDGFLKGFFGAGTGILAAILGSVGLAAGKLVKGTLIVGLLSTFGEKAIKALFDKLDGTALDLNFTKEQEDAFAKNATDGLMGYFLTGLVFRNPLIKLGAGVVAFYKDEVLGAIYKLFGVEETSIGSARDGTVLKYKNIFGQGTIDLPKISETMETGIIAVVTGFLLFITRKVTSMVTWLLRGGQSRTEKKLNKILADQEKKFNKQLDDLENRIKMQQDRIERMNKYSASRTAAGQNLENQIKARQQALLSNIMTDSPDGLKQPRAGDMVKYRTRKGPVVDAEVLKELPNGKLQIKDATGRVYAIDPDVAKTYTPKLPQTSKGQKFLQFLGLLGRGVGKISPMTFGYTSQQNIATGMYGDIDPTIATGIEALSGPGDLLDLINLPFDKALELLGSDFRFGQDAGGKSREAIMGLLASKYLSPSARKRIFGGRDPLAPTTQSFTTEDLSMMIPSADTDDVPGMRKIGRNLDADMIIGYDATRIPTVSMAVAKQIQEALMPLIGSMNKGMIDASQTNVSVGGNNNTIMPSMPQVSDYYDRPSIFK